MSICQQLLSALSANNGIELVGQRIGPWDGTGTLQLVPGIKEGDLVLVSVMAVRSGGSLNASGFFIGTGFSTQIGSYNFNNWSMSPAMQGTLGWKIMGASPEPSIEITNGFNNQNTPGIVQVHVFRGADSVTPFDAGPITNGSSSNPQPDPPSRTSVTSGAAFLVSTWSGNYGGSRFIGYMTNPEYDDSMNYVRNSGGGVNAISAASGFVVQDSAGFFDPSAWSNYPLFTGTACWGSLTLVLRPEQ